MADIYLDSASAMPLSPAARDAMLASLDVFGDPLHIHGPGREARGILDSSRSTVAEAIGAQPDELVFTSAAPSPSRSASGAPCAPSASSATASW